MTLHGRMRANAVSAPPLPRVSIVTPCLNPGDLLRRCIDSVAAQDYPHVEHIVVDGGSSDGTLDYLARSSLRWISEPDEGQSDALNKGFAAATGDVVGWLNADDELMPASISRSVSAIARADATVAYGDLLVITDSDTSYRRTPRRVTRARMLTENPIPQPGSLMRRDALLSVGSIDPNLHLCMDFDLFLRLFDSGARFVHVRHPLAQFHVHPDSKSATVRMEAWWDEFAEIWKRSGRSSSSAVAKGRAAYHRTADSGTPTTNTRCEIAGFYLERIASARSARGAWFRVLSSRCAIGFLAFALRFLDSLTARVFPPTKMLARATQRA